MFLHKSGDIIPTIEISLKTLEKLAGKKVSESDLEIVKGEFDSIEADKAKIEIGDTNRPDLWCVEGIARAIKSYSGKAKGIPKLNFKPSGKKIIVDQKLQKIRPFIAGFIAKNIDIDEEMLLDLIQLQEKLAENYGRKRKKISVGIYNHDLIKFPVNYRAVDPEQVKFAPLDFEHPVSLKEILEKHPKGIEYGYILSEHKLYPIFIDSAQAVLSFPPIINSNYLGKVEPGSQNLFIEVTGTDHKTVLIAANIFAYALQDRGAKIESVVAEYPWKADFGKQVPAPFIFNEKLTFDKSKIKEVLGIDLSDAQIKLLLEKMQYDVSIKKSSITVDIPPYRNDIMHCNDVIEDMAIAYGYNNFIDLPITSFTASRLKDTTLFYDITRRIMIGLEFQEILSNILANKQALCDRMMEQEKIVEIDNIMSETYSAVRNSIIPSLLTCLTKNMHNEFPQRIFELGEVAMRDDASNDGTHTLHKIAACTSDNIASYGEISSVLDALLRNLGIVYELKASEHNSYIQGRCAKIIADDKEIGIIGELHPQVLNNWNLEKPVACFELNATRIFHVVKK